MQAVADRLVGVEVAEFVNDLDQRLGQARVGVAEQDVPGFGPALWHVGVENCCYHAGESADRLAEVPGLELVEVVTGIDSLEHQE